MSEETKTEGPWCALGATTGASTSTDALHFWASKDNPNWSCALVRLVAESQGGVWVTQRGVFQDEEEPVPEVFMDLRAIRLLHRFPGASMDEVRDLIRCRYLGHPRAPQDAPPG